MSSGGSGTPDGRDPHKDGDDRHAEKGDNYGDGQPKLQMSGGSSSNQATTNQQHTLTQKGAMSAHVGFTYGKSDQNEAEQGVDSHDRRGGAQGLDVAGTAMASLGGTPTTQGKKTDSLPEFRNIDYSGHFKVNIDSKGTKNTVLKMKTEEEQFVKFCHLFHCDVQLDVVKEAFQSNLKLDVIKGGYPPSVRTQSGASGPVDISILASLCFQLTAVNISTTLWDIDHVRTILSSLDSYQRGIVIGYEVSGDEASSYWLAGERGSMKSVTETLGQRLGPRSNPVQQSAEYQDKGPARDTIDSGSGDSLTGQQEKSEHNDRHHQQTGQCVSEEEQQQGTDRITERTHGDQHHKALGTTSQDHHSEEEHGRPGGSGSDTRPRGSGSDTRPGGSGSDTRPGGSGSDTRPGGSGSDTRLGGGGSDTRPGHSGSDTRPGGSGSDTRPGGSGSDTRPGGNGPDTRPGHSGSDTRPRCSGSDTRPGGSGPENRLGGSGSDTRPGGNGSDTRPGGSGPDNRPGGSGSDTRPGGSGSDTRPGCSGSDTRPGGSGPDNRWGGSGSDTRPLGMGGTGEGHNDPSLMGQQKDRFSDTTQPSMGRQQVGIDDHTRTSEAGQLVRDNDPHGSGVTRDDGRTDIQKEAVNLEPARSGKEEDGGIPYADDDSEGTSSLTETQRASQQQLADHEWSGQNVNSSPQGSMSTPVDQTIDRYQGQGQIGVHRDSVRVQTGGQSAEVQNMSSPTTVDHYTLPQGQLPYTKPDVHHEAETSTITMEIKLGRLEENILSCLPLIIMDLRHKFQHVEIDWKKGRHTVTITGDEVDVRQITTEIDKQLKAVKEDKVEINSKQMKQEALNMFRERSVLDYLSEHIRSLKVACYLTKHEDSNGVYLCIYAADTDIKRAVRLVTSSVVCRETELDSTWRLFLESLYVQQELSDLQKKYNGKVAITTQEGLVTVSCTADIENVVLTTVNKMKKDFFSEVTKTVEYKPCGDLTVELEICTKVLHSDIQMIEEKYNVKCCPVQNNKKQGWKVTGPYGTLEIACNTLKELSTTVSSRHLPLEDKISEDFFRTQPGQDDMARVGENTGCLVTLFEQEVASSPGTLGQVTSGRQGQVSATEKSNRSNVAGRQWRSGDGRVVALYCGNGRKSTSDVLVQLTQNKGTQAVQFQRCQGRVTITLNLPEWRDGSNKEKDTIRKHFKEIIIMAAEKAYTSLTVLLDDCQQCGWKKKKACKLLVKNTLYCLQREPAGACSCAYFVSDQETFMTLRDVIDDSFRDTTQEIPSITDDKDEVALDWEHVHPSDIEERKGQIVLQKGELAKMACDVLVNTTDTSLTLDIGAVSASILSEAGPEIQTACTQYHYRGVKCGEVAITHGYKLKCKRVFHGALPSYKTDPQLKYMISFLWRCLTVADKKRYRTISFPALGTGNLGYPRDLVAKTMFDTVNSYFSEGKDSSIEIVSFVVYPKDTPTVKAFQDEEQKQKMKVLQATSKPTPPVSERTAQLQLRYGPVDLWVTVGQIDTATADGLLIFWDYTSLYKSPFSCSYFNENINPDGVNQLRSKRTFMSSKGMTVVTGAGSLHFKSVIHCLIKEDTNDFQTVMSALAEADNRNLSSVVLSLGTKEPLTRLKAKIVNQFHDALKQFNRRNKTLRRVEIMFDSEDTFKDTRKSIRSRYHDRLVENQNVTGEEPLGATGGVQTRSMTMEANAKQTSDGNPTQTMYRTNLVVAGRLEDTIEKAIQQLKNKISNIKTQHPTVQAPSPAATTSGQDSHPERPPRPFRNRADAKPEPKVSRRQDDQNSSPVTKSPILETIEYEEKRLVLKSKPLQTLEKESIKAWLEKNGSKNCTVVWPFLQDTEALIIFPSVNDAKKLLKNGDDQYSVDEFPRQTVQNLKATLKTAMVEMIKKCMEPTMIPDKMFRESGAEWLEENGTCFLKGSLPEIQCAYRFIVELTTGGNLSQGNRQRSNKDGDGAAQRNGQNRRTNLDISNNGEVESSNDITSGYERQGSVDNTSLQQRSKNDESLSQERENHGRNRHGPDLHSNNHQDNVKQTSKSNNESVRGNETFQDQECAPYRTGYDGHRLQSTFGNKSYDIETEPRTTGSQGDPRIDMEEAITKTLYNERGSTKNWFGGEEGQPSDKGNASLINKEGNLRSKETKRHHSKEYQSGGFDNLSRENVDYDNAPRFHMSDDGRETEKQDKTVHSTICRDEDSSIETVTCSAEQFHEICFFNQGIGSAIKVVFNTNRTECHITDSHGCFSKAKSQLSSYGRIEVDNLTKTEQEKFKKYFEHENKHLDMKKLFCEYNLSRNQIRLVGEKHDVQQAEQRILEAIGRPGQTDHRKGCENLNEEWLTKRSSKRKKSKTPPPELLQTKYGIRIFVYKADLLDLDVDTIVYGANSNLSYSHGLAQQIAQGAGPKFEEACRNIFAERGTLNASDCCFTTAGQLHNQYIIHAVAPMWSVYKKEKMHGEMRKIYQDDLCRTVMNALIEAKDCGARSVALPAIGYGQCPSDVQAAATREAVALYCEKHTNSTLNQIHFVDWNEDILKRISNELLSSSELNVGSSHEYVTARVSNTQNKPGAPQVPPVLPQVFPQCVSKHNADVTYMLSEHLSVCIMSGTYVKTAASALVSIEDEHFQSDRYVAKEISKAAGERYQKEIDTLRKKKSKCKISDVFLTGAGDIKNADRVLHVIGPVADKTISEDPELFKGFADCTRACISKILKTVNEKNLDSVALPTFASGTLKTKQTNQIWEICVEEVEKFATRQDTKSKVKMIFLVCGYQDVRYLLQLFSSKI